LKLWWRAVQKKLTWTEWFAPMWRDAQKKMTWKEPLVVADVLGKTL
jgi:hypothetical protein